MALADNRSEISAGLNRLEQERKLRYFKLPATFRIAILGIDPPKFPKTVGLGMMLHVEKCQLIASHVGDRTSTTTTSQLLREFLALMKEVFPSIGIQDTAITMSPEDTALLVDYLPIIHERSD